MKILILGATGMLGNTLFRYLSDHNRYHVYGTFRQPDSLRFFNADSHINLIQLEDVLDTELVKYVIESLKPDWVINCIGLIKQDPKATDRALAIRLNALLPHELAGICEYYQCRLIQISTDCVFSGRQGDYHEDDVSDAEDIYGKTKYLGEILDKTHVLTLRTSIIGHELNSQRSLLDWFLSQSDQVSGYCRAVFSGLPTTELARVLDEYILRKSSGISGLFQLAGAPISKYELLKIIADVYGKQIEIIPDRRVVIDRSLNTCAFTAVTGYISPDWRFLIEQMYKQRTC